MTNAACDFYLCLFSDNCELCAAQELRLIISFKFYTFKYFQQPDTRLCFDYDY